MIRFSSKLFCLTFFISITNQTNSFDYNKIVSGLIKIESSFCKIFPFIIVGARIWGNDLETAPEVSASLKKLIKALLVTKGINSDFLKIKSSKRFDLSATKNFQGSFINIPPDQAEVLIKNNLSKISHQWCILHEIGHIKYNHYFKKLLCYPLIFFLVNKIFNSKAIDLYDKLDNKGLLKALKNSLVLFIAFKAKCYIFTQLAYTLSKFHEASADKFALSKFNTINDIDAIVESANLSLDREIKRIQDTKKDKNFITINRFAKFFYHLSKSKDDFSIWLKNNPFWIRLINELDEPTHPSVYDRLHYALNRKKEILSSQTAG